MADIEIDPERLTVFHTGEDSPNQMGMTEKMSQYIIILEVHTSLCISL